VSCSAFGITNNRFCGLRAALYMSLAFWGGQISSLSPEISRIGRVPMREIGTSESASRPFNYTPVRR
jgi:hypothetical protein